MTLLGFINRVFFQWFFIRLAKEINTETGQTEKWFILKWVVPLTGWNSNYKFIKDLSK